ncbi:hypothetical protein ACLF6K_40070 (plasmid) [Streptomyces xanthophaeus]
MLEYRQGPGPAGAFGMPALGLRPGLPGIFAIALYVRLPAA